MSTITETTTLKPSPAAIAIIVFGRDEAGKAHASWFDQAEAALAEKAADLMGLRVLRVRTDEHRALAAQLPHGRVFASGRAFVPFTKASLFMALQAATQAAADAKPVKLVVSADDGSEAKLPITEPKPTAGSPNGKAPCGWADIDVGSIVLASEGRADGWWESVVIEAKGDLFTLIWEDWPDLPRFVRRRCQLALLHPAGRARA
jgi:hypothetical protein